MIQIWKTKIGMRMEKESQKERSLAASKVASSGLGCVM